MSGRRARRAALRPTPLARRARPRRLLLRARRDVQAAIAEAAPGGYTALALRSLERSIGEALAGFGRDAGAAAAAGQQRAWDAGIDTVDRPLSAAISLDATPYDLASVLPEVDTEQLRAMREFLTTKMRGVGTAMADRINTELGLAVIGSQGFAGAVEAVQRITGSGRSRALTVARTEIGRAYSVAGQARMAQAGEELPGLRKQWRRSGKIHSRLTHDLADGQVQPVDEPFRVSGRRIMYPRDPAAPPGETINCGCQSLPWMEEWDVLTPGRREYSARELALDPRKRDLAGALAGPPSSPPPPPAGTPPSPSSPLAGGRPGGGTPAPDPLALPAFLRRSPGAPQPDLDAPGARAARTDRPAETAAEFRKRPDYRTAKQLPGKAAAYYGEDDYADINQRLREGRALETSRARGIVDDMVSAMRETTEDVEVWRGRGSRKDYLVGDEIEDKAFSSWSTSYKTAQNFAGGWAGKAEGTLYRLRLPKGARAVVENEVEQEVLLGPGTKYRVAEIVDNADKGANKLYRGPSRVYVLEVVEGTDGAG